MKNQLEELLGKGRIEERKDLFPHLSMRLHCTADYFFNAKSGEDLVNAVKAAHTLHIPLSFLGGGSNAVFSASRIPGLTVRNSFSSITDTDEGEYREVTVGSGTPMALLVEKTITMGVSGFEYHKGLPGSVGGAIYMNSKWTKPVHYVGDNLLFARLIEKNGTIKNVDRQYFHFAYDYSVLQKTKEIVLSVTFRLKKEDTDILRQRAEEAFGYRKNTQPTGAATCGCFFRNISESEQDTHHLPTKSAGYLIDKCGLKGFSIGGFSVSTVHANFIVNDPEKSGKPEDLHMLVDTIKSKVKERFGVILEEEVQVIS